MTPRSCLNHALTLASCRPTVNRGYQRRIWLFVGAAALASVSYIATLDAQGTRGRPAAKTPAARFRTTLTPDQMNGKQVVVQTGMGTFVIQLLPAAAPNHVGYVIDRARAGAYDGTTFHRAIKYGIIQGGDPLSKEPAHKAKYGTGGLGILDAEISGETMTRGAVAAVVQPGKPNSAGSQFFIAVTDQPALEGQYTIFGRVIEGMEVVQKISEAATDANGRVTDRIEMTHVTIRDAPPVEPEPFVTESVEDLARHRAVLETTMGPITLAFLPDKAPGHVRNFLRLASLGAYDGTAFHRVVRGFVLQGGMLNTRTDAVPQRVQQVRPHAGPGVQRHAAREGHALHGPHGRPGQRLHLVLHLHGTGAITGRQVHRVRARGGGNGRRGSDRRRAGRRRNPDAAPRGDEGHGQDGVNGGIEISAPDRPVGPAGTARSAGEREALQGRRDEEASEPRRGVA